MSVGPSIGSYAGAELPERQKLLSIQYLRALAATMVVVHHILHQSSGFLTLVPTEAFQSGVDIFFVISGFVMVFVTTFSERTPGIFLAARAVRIVPVYWFYTLGAVALARIVPTLFRTEDPSMRRVVSSLMFWPLYTEDAGWGPVIKQGWTLNYEVFFYLVFGVAMAVTYRRRSEIAATLLIATVVIGSSLDKQTGPSYFYSRNIVMEFVLGMVIAIIFLGGFLRRLGGKAPGAILAVGFVMLFTFNFGDRLVDYGIPAALIVVAALAFEQNVGLPSLRSAVFIGDSSYSIYLVHIFPIAVLRSCWPTELAGRLNLVLFTLLTMIAVFLCSAVSYKLIERPSVEFFRRSRGRRRQKS